MVNTTISMAMPSAPNVKLVYDLWLHSLAPNPIFGDPTNDSFIEVMKDSNEREEEV